MEYIDVRGPWPIYVNGSRAYKLEGFAPDGKIIDRNISLEQARTLADQIEAQQEAARPNLDRVDA